MSSYSDLTDVLKCLSYWNVCLFPGPIFAQINAQRFLNSPLCNITLHCISVVKLLMAAGVYDCCLPWIKSGGKYKPRLQYLQTLTPEKLMMFLFLWIINSILVVQCCISTIAATVFCTNCPDTDITKQTYKNNTLLISFLLLSSSNGYCFQSGVTAQFCLITAEVGCSIDSGSLWT